MPGSESSSPEDSALDVLAIADRLPHRYPFLFVDRVLELVPESRIVALKNVTVNEPYFNGHFPGRPILPGVLVCEALAQAGGLLALGSKELAKGRVPLVLAGMERVRFRQPVVPGDQLRLEVDLRSRHRPLWKLRGRALVDGRVVAEADLLMMESDLQAEFRP